MMKLSALLIGLATAAATAHAHATVWGVWINGVDQGNGQNQYIRSPPNNNPVKDLNSNAVACNANNRAVPTTLKVKAGDTVTFEWFHDSRNDEIIATSHKGPIVVYIAPTSSNGAGNVWVKLYQEGYNGNWAVDKLIAARGKHSIRIPNIAAGNYLLRPELITLHEADTAYSANPARGVQFYMSCIQIEVQSSGSTLPSGVAFPGLFYKAEGGLPPFKISFHLTDRPAIVYIMTTSVSQYLVIGANRGLGLEFVRQLLRTPENKVIATYRDASKLDELNKLGSDRSNAGRLELVRLDMNDDGSCKVAANEIQSKVGPIDVLIINAGIIDESNSLLQKNIDDLADLFQNNVLGPLRITQHFAPLLNTRQLSKLVFLTSQIGSISRGKNGTSPSYGISNAALNMMGRKLAHELEPSNVAVALVHPGWVQTDMGGPNAPVTPAQSISGMLKVIDKVDLKNSGEYWQWDGQQLPW
ncbi:unnamed protein product [Rhizoctonia solani]|uniref:AA9 family lytic polysaccharide monooxygenase n=1 Tax=Rhizoctonia solani TaxID=456999 RepID=A0A8H2WMI0_9AGAM|nr:unnamed protein product [Rhizoctonia solani]